VILEATVQPASSGFGMYQRSPEAPAETAFRTLEEFAAHMNREYDWRWATDIDGKIYDQDGGKPFAWRASGQPDDEGWSYGLVYEQD
jgi:hypothetical protein